MEQEPYYNLGSHRRSVSTNSEDANTWFSRGLVWIYGFNFEMGQRCFSRAIKIDPRCAMFYWGLAYCSGIYYNKPWHKMQRDELTDKLEQTYRASRQALDHVNQASPVERALIEALVSRYQSPGPAGPGDFSRWNNDYANAMREVYLAFPDDDDVCTLFAEALMCRTPWALWDLKSGEPAEGASTLEAVEVLERTMNRIEASNKPPHPGILHLYIHVMEMSPFPHKALPASDALRELVIDSGHLCHMPSHIDVRCGHYLDAVIANDKAIAADREFVKREGAMNFHTLSRIHNFHLKVYASLFLGRFKEAMEASEELVASTPEALLRIESPAMADWMEGYMGMKAHVYIRFGKWQEIIDTPLPEDQKLYCMTTAVWHYARTIAFAATGDVEAAEAEKAEFIVAASQVPETRLLFNNTCVDVLKIAEQMMNGEIEYRKQNYSEAFGYLRKAVYLDDNLEYDEPWGWMQPARHALGALLLEQGHVEQALEVYCADLGLDDSLAHTSRHPHNIWSLHGCVECLEALGRKEEAVAMSERLQQAAKLADVAVNASCYCRLQHRCCD